MSSQRTYATAYYIVFVIASCQVSDILRLLPCSSGLNAAFAAFILSACVGRQRAAESQNLGDGSSLEEEKGGRLAVDPMHQDGRRTATAAVRQTQRPLDVFEQ